MTIRGPERMFSHTLEPLSGWWDEHTLQKTGILELEDDETMHKGSVMSISPADGNFRKGLIWNTPAVFAFNGSEEHDAASDYPGSAIGPGNDGAAIDGSNILGLPCLGAFELETTEFDTEVSYSPMQPLTGFEPGHAKAGLITAGEFFEDTVCGIVTDGVNENHYGYNALRFWTYFLPSSAASSDAV